MSLYYDDPISGGGARSPWAELRHHERARAEGTAQEFDFGDLLDVVNPLQHLPVVSTVYRELTGDTIEGPARIMGDALYGGVGGLISGIVDAIAEEASGDDLGGHVMTAMGLGGEDTEPRPQMAEAEPAAAATTAAATARAETGSPAPASASVSASASAAEMEGAARDRTAQRDMEAQRGPDGADGDPAAQGAEAPAGALTGQAALAALARDLRGGGAEPAQAQRSAGDARSMPERGSQGGPTPPDSFMPVSSRDRMGVTRPTRGAEALRAEGDLMGHRRLQAAPTAPGATAAQATADRAAAATDGPADPGRRTTATPPANPAGPAAAAGAAEVATEAATAAPGPATSGDFAARMRQALEKYQALREQR